MLATGIVVCLSVGLVLVKLPRRSMLRALRHDIAIDLAVSAVVLVIHWGTKWRRARVLAASSARRP
jgi:hypothetical protein